MGIKDSADLTSGPPKYVALNDKNYLE
jgi:hypothetical protein